MSESRFRTLRAPLLGAASLAATAALLALNTGAAQAQTVNFTGINLTNVSSAFGQNFASVWRLSNPGRGLILHL